MRRWARALLALALLAGCSSPPPPLPPQGLSLARVRSGDLPGWTGSNPDAALAAFRRGCEILVARPPDAPMGGAGYAGTAGDWREVCAVAATAADARQFFESRFMPFAVGGGPGLFTGYYQPQINASHRRQGVFTAPAYGPPADLVRADLGAFIPKLKGEHISGRVTGHALQPYPDRARIDADGIANAPVLFWADPIDLFFLQIQGSGRVRFEDGSLMDVGYGGENGQPYTAIGRDLIAQGALTKENVSLAGIRAWLVAHPGQARALMETNRSYVFLREKPGAAEGTLGTGLVPLGSMAVDMRLHALGAPFFVAADGPDPVHGILIAQDTGGAIRGPVRGDIFFGMGVDAERRAGEMKAPGALYVLLPNALAAKLGAHWTPP